VSEPFDAIVVGAGPAGSAAAAMLAARGRRVLVFEKERFPRRKVCGEFLSGDALESLERLGVREDVEARAERIREGELYLRNGRPIAFHLPERALGISRFVLDDLLARRAAELGAEFRFGARQCATSRRKATVGASAFPIGPRGRGDPRPRRGGRLGSVGRPRPRAQPGVRRPAWTLPRVEPASTSPRQLWPDASACISSGADTAVSPRVEGGG
jgi:hypothetical protein